MQMTAKVLLIDDDPELGKLIDIVLRPVGVTLYQAYSGLEGLRNVYALQPDLVILDVMMPEMDGFEVCGRIRELADMPVLMLTARTTDADMLQGFRAGADDFIKKPFKKNELEVRVRALLRRPAHGPVDPATIHSYNDTVLEIDLLNRTVKLCGEAVRLSPREYGLLAYLVGVQGRVATYDELMQDVWGEPQINAASLIALYVFYLRKKLQDGHHGHQYIRTNWGKGYWFEARRQPAASLVREEPGGVQVVT
jgi:DNA-binding response OmpR family regulator